MLTERPETEPLALVSRMVVSLIALGAFAVATRWSVRCCAGIDAPRALAAAGAVFAFGVALAAIAVLAKREIVKRLAAELALIGLVLVTVEVAITATRPHTWTQNPAARKLFEQQRAARKMGIELDTRSISEVVAALRSQGVEALPGIARSWPTLSDVAPHLPPEFYPLSHAANSTIVECNEGGQHLVYESDELGFNNPRGLVASQRIDIAVVGESHGLGYCVQRGRSMVELIREAYPGTANFAFAYSRSLSQLGSFREYVEPLRPRVVVWLVNPGLASAATEADNATLLRYLDESFSQGLIDRQRDVDALVRELAIPIQEAADRAMSAEVERARTDRFAQVHELPQIRAALTPWRAGAPVPPPELGSFEQVMRVAQRTVDRWGGVLLVVVLPLYSDIVAGEAPEAQRHSLVMQITTKLGLRVVDGAALFRAVPDPAGLFALRIQNHPNYSGHALLAHRIIDEIRKLPRVEAH